MNLIRRVFTAAKAIVLWAKSILSEKDGTGSASRVVKWMIASTCCLALLCVVWFKHDLPSADQLSALAKVIAAGSAAYAFNQIKNGWTGDGSSAPNAEPEHKPDSQD
jgi:hypothetical protein